MNSISNFIVPALFCLIIIFGLSKRVKIFDVFVEGAKDGLKTAVGLVPTLVALMTAIGMFNASGALDVLSHGLQPVAALLGVPEEIMPLALLRPISGSGAMVIFQNILAQTGADSYAGRVASVLMGSSETTFYTIAVYYGAISVAKTRHTLPSALTGDLVALIVSALAVRIFLGT